MATHTIPERYFNESILDHKCGAVEIFSYSFMVWFITIASGRYAGWNKEETIEASLKSLATYLVIFFSGFAARKQTTLLLLYQLAQVSHPDVRPTALWCQENEKPKIIL